MAPPLRFTQCPFPGTYSEIIDVRSPAEFAADHIPCAINLPALDDAERAKVGTLYKQVSPFTARKVGAALIARNFSQYLSHHFADKPKTYHPLIYCWRGGQRSNSMASVLIQIGWQVTLLEGGYKTYRAYVRDQLEHLPPKFSCRVLCGLTGTGKTRILEHLAQCQMQVVDLEKLANHRGSLLGEMVPSAQPSQKLFESLLLDAFQHLDLNRPVWLEAESPKIGQVYLPRSLWTQMQQSRTVEIQVPLHHRVQWLLTEYSHLGHTPQILKEKLSQLKSRYGTQQIQQWQTLVDRRQGADLVESLLKVHYDPAYRRSLQKHYAQMGPAYPLRDLSEASLTRLISTLKSLPSVDGAVHGEPA